MGDVSQQCLHSERARINMVEPWREVVSVQHRGQRRGRGGEERGGGRLTTAAAFQLVKDHVV